MAIAKVESNLKTGVTNTNRNGSTDYCHMQINTFWRPILGSYWPYLKDPCYCTTVGAWVLKRCIQRFGNSWDAVACYNTGHGLNVQNLAKKRRAENYVNKIKVALNTILK